MNTYRFSDIQSIIASRGLLYPLDVMLVGATGTGKSSTLNALFGSEVAKVGTGVDPETQKISSSRLHEYLRFHDSAGLGDGIEADRHHAKNITSQLLSTCTCNNEDYGFIDMALVILDGGSRDLGTAFDLLERVVLESISGDRVIVAVNQADMAMKGRYWNHSTGRPEPRLVDFLENQMLSIQQRLLESTSQRIPKPVYYSAAYNYNTDALMDHIIRHMPKKRRPKI